MKMTTGRLLLIVALPHLATVGFSQGVISFGQPTLGGGGGGLDQVQGWEFVPQTDLTVLQVGLYDGHGSGGFQQPHAVALWDSGGALIVSASIPQGESAPLLNNFRYVPIAPIVLQSGETYVIGAFMPAPASDYTVLWGRSSLGNGTVSLDSRIGFLAYRAGLSPGEISFPEARYVDYVGGFGPNFIVAVPEPSCLSLAITAAMLAVSQLRARRAAPSKPAAPNAGIAPR